MGKTPKADSPSPHSRSKVTNGNSLFVEADSRGPWPRRFKDLIAAHVADLGGADGLSEAQKQLVRRAVTMEIELERMEGQSWPWNFGQFDKWIFCLTAARILAANQERR
jgi:hypothetical protein